jgi:hypothetical protein
MENEVKEPAPKYNYISPEQYGNGKSRGNKHDIIKVKYLPVSASPHIMILCTILTGWLHPFYMKDVNYMEVISGYISLKFIIHLSDFSIVCGKTETPDI